MTFNGGLLEGVARVSGVSARRGEVAALIVGRAATLARGVVLERVVGALGAVEVDVALDEGAEESAPARSLDPQAAVSSTASNDARSCGRAGHTGDHAHVTTASNRAWPLRARVVWSMAEEAGGSGGRPGDGRSQRLR